jgi:hypothetical protein
MPYIRQERRDEVNKIIALMQELNVEANGDLNYILFAYCKWNITPSYNQFKNFCGELRQCATEIERKLLAPYEDEKEKINGNI